MTDSLIGNLLIFGAGQYGILAKEIAEDMGCFGKIAFLDDASEKAIGKMSEYEKYIPEYEYAFAAFGNSELRLSLINKLRGKFTIATLVHPKAFVSRSAELGIGCIVEPLAAVNAGVILEEGVIVSSGAVVNHNSFVGSGCHIDCGAVVQARAKVPDGTKMRLC